MVALEIVLENIAAVPLSQGELTLYSFCALLVLVSVLYSCAGQAGASGYIATMALFGFAPEVIKPTALVLNVLVSVVVSANFYRAGHLSWRLLLPFAAFSVPAAILGGSVTLPPLIFNRLLGVSLVVCSVPLFITRDWQEHTIKPPKVYLALFTGAAIGLLSGLTGVGGGVLITPILLYCRWATVKSAAAVSAVFILINSLAALLGHFGGANKLPQNLALFALAVVLGGAIGSQLGSLHLSTSTIHRVLGAVLFIAGLKLFYS